MYAEVSNPIPSTTVVADEDEPSYSVDEWHDCQQEDDAVSGPDVDVTAYLGRADNESGHEVFKLSTKEPTPTPAQRRSRSTRGKLNL